MTMFEGETPVKIRLADTGKLVGTHCLNHPRSCRSAANGSGRKTWL